MNKGRRHEIKMLKYRKRLKNYGLPESEGHHAFRTSGKPCSCFLCSPHKFTKEEKAKYKNMDIITWKDIELWS